MGIITLKGRSAMIRVEATHFEPCSPFSILTLHEDRSESAGVACGLRDRMLAECLAGCLASRNQLRASAAIVEWKKNNLRS